LHSFNVRHTVELELIGALLGLCPTALMVSFLTGEAPSSFTSISVIPWTSWICFGGMAAALAGAPFVRGKLALGSSPRSFAAASAAGVIASVITGALLLGETMSVSQIVGLAVFGLGAALWHFSLFPSRSVASTAALIAAASGDKVDELSYEAGGPPAEGGDAVAAQPAGPEVELHALPTAAGGPRESVAPSFGRSDEGSSIPFSPGTLHRRARLILLCVLTS
jgi:uncharacterized membrane protein